MENPEVTSYQVPDEVAAFQSDRLEMIRLTGENKRQSLTRTSDDAARMAIIGDNFTSCMNLAEALETLIEARNHEGSLVVFRALYEACVNLIYLYNVGDRTQNALLARAFAAQEIGENYATIGGSPQAAAIAKEHRRIYNSMPAALRRELAANRKRERNHWSGVGLKTRAKRIGVVGHEALYKGMSWEVHTTALGRLSFEKKEGDLHLLQLHRILSEQDAQGAARLARTFLRGAWSAFSREFIGEVLPLSAPPPPLGPPGRSPT